MSQKNGRATATARSAQEVGDFVAALERSFDTSPAEHGQVTMFAQWLCQRANLHREIKGVVLDAGSGAKPHLERTEQEIRRCARLTKLGSRAGILDVRFFDDPRGTTVGLVLATGDSNSLTGTWKIPSAEAEA